MAADDDPVTAARRRYEHARRAQRAAATASYESQQRLGSVYYRSRRIEHMQTILENARTGTLTTDWRDRITEPDYIAATAGVPGYQLYSDADTLLLNELRNMPIAAWEPHAGAGWRNALHAWHTAAEQTIEDYTAMRQTVQDAMARPEMHAATREHIRHSLDFVATRERDLYGASYRAGLAAGGEPNDWRHWLRQRVQTWPDTPVRTTTLQQLQNPCYRSDLEYLPHYWLNHSQQARS